MAIMYVVYVILAAIAFYVITKLLEVVRSFVKTQLSKYNARQSEYWAKQKDKDEQLRQIPERLFRSMEEVIDRIGGPVLEIGAGNGAHLKHFPSNTRLITIDLNEHFRPFLMKNLETHKHVTHEKYLIGNCEDMTSQVDDNSCACVVSSALLCSVNQSKALSEIHRVLKPGGRFYFIEHIIAEPWTFTRCFQLMFRKMWQLYRDGCTITCDTDQVISQRPGFVNLNAYTVERNLPLRYFFARRAYVGYADKIESD